jgi:hypothetical protein
LRGKVDVRAGIMDVDERRRRMMKIRGAYLLALVHEGDLNREVEFAGQGALGTLHGHRASLARNSDYRMRQEKEEHEINKNSHT